MSRMRKTENGWVKTSGDAYIPKYTLAEYEKIKDTIPVGTEFIITDDYAESGSKDIYDEEERVIGTWFGKPLYRKTVQASTPSNLNTATKICDLPNIDTMVNLYGSYANFPCQYYFYDNVSVYITTWLNGAKNALYNITNANSTLNKSGFVTIEYTKTTD